MCERARQVKNQLIACVMLQLCPSFPEMVGRRRPEVYRAALGKGCYLLKLISEGRRLSLFYIIVFQLIFYLSDKIQIK